MANRRRQRRRERPSRWLWAATVALALAGPAAYLVWDTTLLWYVAPFAVIPLYVVVDQSGRQSREAREQRRHFSTGDSGPWTPPDGF